jgi:hypothetical protein
MAPGSTASLVPIADRLIQAIDAGDPASTRDQISALTKGIGDVYRAEVKRRASETMSGASDADTAAHERYLALGTSLGESLGRNSIAESVALATELQAVVEDRRAKHEYLGNYGFDLYRINDAFGRAAFARGDYTAARDYLLKQTEIPPEGLSILCCFGPNLWLAQSLLGVGYRDDVLTFLQGIGTFWTKEAGGRREGWIADLKRGATPDMRTNNSVDFGYRP